MKKICLCIGFILCTLFVLAQDEGVIQKKERLAKDKSIYLTGGPALTFGDNIGDYSTGIYAELGFTKRLNSVFSIGPSLVLYLV